MIRVLELFAGIGACSKALERLGIEHEIVDAVEIDKFAIKSFNAIHGTNFEPQDITKWDKDIECDLIMHGSPCQDFSIAGKQAGGDEGSGTRSSLLYETLRIVEKLKPEVVIWENVKNLLSKKHIHNHNAYVDKMNSLGYETCAAVLNAKNYGIPQNRERVFTISIRKGNKVNKEGFHFLEPVTLDKKLKDFLEENVDEKYYLSEDKINMIRAWKCYERPLDHVMELDSICGMITTRSGAECGGVKLVRIDNRVAIKNATKKGYDMATNGDGIDLAYPNSNTRRGRVGHGVCKTIETKDSMGVLVDYRIRKLTPRECWRLMGFEDSDFDKAQATGMSNAQLYKQAGNSIVVNVLEAILKSLYK